MAELSIPSSPAYGTSFLLFGEPRSGLASIGQSVVYVCLSDLKLNGVSDISGLPVVSGVQNHLQSDRAKPYLRVCCCVTPSDFVPLIPNQ